MKTRAALPALAILLATSDQAAAQVQAGPFKMNLSGNVTGGYTSDFGSAYNGTLDNISSGISFNPINNLNIGATAQYNDNLLGSIYLPILAAGGVLPQALPEQSSHALDVIGYANYRIEKYHLTFSATDDHRDESLLGFKLTSNVVQRQRDSDCERCVARFRSVAGAEPYFGHPLRRQFVFDAFRFLFAVLDQHGRQFDQLQQP